jgi:hypothetical protein
MADSDLNEINRTLGSVLAELTNLKEDLKEHRGDAQARNDNTIARLDNAAMRLGKLETQIADIAPEVGTLKKLRERGLGIVGAVGLIGIGLGTVGTFLATHWGTVMKVISSFFKV